MAPQTRFGSQPRSWMNFPVPTTRLTPIRAAVTLPAAALLLVVVFAPVPNALRSITLRALFDFAHFSLAAAGCWFLWARFRCSGWAAFATVVAAAALCEVLAELHRALSEHGRLLSRFPRSTCGGDLLDGLPPIYSRRPVAQPFVDCCSSIRLANQRVPVRGGQALLAHHFG